MAIFGMIMIKYQVLSLPSEMNLFAISPGLGPTPIRKPGALGKSMVFLYNADWEGKQFEEKEVTVYYKIKNERVVILTAIARYGSNFPKKGDVK